jgi:hypothetical protein
MAKKPPITNVTSGFSSTIALNSNFTSLRDGFDNTLSLDGSTPNAMQTELDLANNNIINAGNVETDTLILGGVLMTPSGVDPVYSGTISSFGASLIDDADAATARTTLGLGTAATSPTTDFVTKTNDSTIEDNVKVKFGTDNNLEIFHDGSNSYIKETGTGNLIIDTDGSQLKFKSGTDSLFEATVTGGVNLRHNNVSKLQTYSGGVNVTGIVNATSFAGDGSNLTNTPNKSFAEAYVTYSVTTPTLVDGYGFSSVSRPAQGQTSFVFSTAQPDTDYVVDIKYQGGIGASDARWSSWVYAKSTTGYTVMFKFITLTSGDVPLWTTARRLT